MLGKGLERIQEILKLEEVNGVRTITLSSHLLFSPDWKIRTIEQEEKL